MVDVDLTGAVGAALTLDSTDPPVVLLHDGAVLHHEVTCRCDRRRQADRLSQEQPLDCDRSVTVATRPTPGRGRRLCSGDVGCELEQQTNNPGLEGDSFTAGEEDVDLDLVLVHVLT